MATVKLVDDNCPDPLVQEVFNDIKATKKIERVTNFWRALANNPQHLKLVWTQLKTVMRPGKVDLLTKEIIALAVSATNSCEY
jgi:alkylhydroperoxidase family enzyme